MRTILVIDDDATFSRMIQYVLRQEGYKVLTASDGKQGVSRVREERPDLILMDMCMPGHDGRETAEYLQAIGHFSGIPLIFLTGVVVEDKPEGGDRIDIDGHAYPLILKTVGRDELLRRVKQALLVSERKCVRVLVVEDSATDAHFIKRALEKSFRRAFDVCVVRSIHEAEEMMRARDNDVLLLDLALPDSQKKDTLLWMLKCEVPIVVMTGDEDEATVGEAFRHGAQDYIVKGDCTERELVRCIIYALERAHSNREMLLFRKHFERLVQDRVNVVVQEVGKAKEQGIG